MLSDLRAEIKPHGILDLERVASRSAIDASLDLKHALKTKSVQLGRHTTVHVKPSPQIIEREKIVEREIDEHKLANIIRNVVSEEIGKIPQPEKHQEIVKPFDFNDLFNQIRDQINSIKIKQEPQKSLDTMGIKPEQFAEISQKSIDKITEDIETGKSQKKKVVQIINKDKLEDLAGQL
jgi:hypothetical protein